MIPSLLQNNQSLCMQPFHAASLPAPGAHSAPSLFMQPEVLLLVIFAVTLWLLGVVSGLLLPIVLQRASHLWRRPESISDDDSATAPGLQSRPLSDVDADEPYEDDLLNHSHSALQPAVLAPGGGAHLTPHWHLGEADLQPFQAAVEPVKGQLLTGDLAWAGWNFIM